MHPEVDDDPTLKENRYIQIHSHIFSIDKETIAYIAIWSIIVFVIVRVAIAL